MENANNVSRDSVLNVSKNQYAEHQRQEIINQSRETTPIKDVRITDVSQPNCIQNLANELESMYINTEEVLAKAGELSTINQNMVNEFVTNMANLDNSWTASAAGNAMSSFETIKEHLSARNTQMNNYIELIKQVIVSGYEETETSNTTLADAFK